MNDSSSKTAEFMALFRAMESGYRRERRLFADPFARSFLSPALKAASDVSHIPLIGRIIPYIIDKKWAGARGSGVARTKLIDAYLTDALKSGVKQVVILGAGYDCRAYRLEEMRAVRVFEVDHPNTLQQKRAKLKNIAAPHVQYAAIDFTKQNLNDVLSTVGFDKREKSFFIWEGVTNYLDAASIDAIIRFLGTLATGTKIAFTYIHSDILENPQRFAASENLEKLLHNSGEPWTFGFLPEALPGYLAERGLSLLEDWGSVAYRARCMNPKGRHMKGYEFYRAALCAVG
jgi:methyltransferase (TIGR00027 family)